MKQYVIERSIPGIGGSSAADFDAITEKSCGVLDSMSGIKWLHSYVTGDKIYCVYEAENEDKIRQHAQAGGFPADTIEEVKTTLRPTR